MKLYSALPGVSENPLALLSLREKKSLHSVVREESLKTRTCAKCGAVENLHKHHITYRRKTGGERFDKLYLCLTCHAIITGLNTKYSRKVGKLTNKQRKFLFWDVFFPATFEKEDELEIGLKILVGTNKNNQIGSVVDGQQPIRKTPFVPTSNLMSSCETPVQVNRSK